MTLISLSSGMLRSTVWLCFLFITSSWGLLNMYGGLYRGRESKLPNLSKFFSISCYSTSSSSEKLRSKFSLNFSVKVNNSLIFLNVNLYLKGIMYPPKRLRSESPYNIMLNPNTLLILMSTVTIPTTIQINQPMI